MAGYQAPNDTLGVGVADHTHAKKVMAQLQQALLQNKQIEGSYRSPHLKRATKVRLQPRRVFFCGQAWYLAAYCNKSQDTRLYRLARFTGVNVLDKTNENGVVFSLREMLGNAWSVHRGDCDYYIEIEFEKDTAELVSETNWHHTQELAWQKDGTMLFHVTVSGLEEIKWWIMGWGPRAKVTKPKELIQEIKSLATQMVGQYEHSLQTKRGRQ